MLLTPEECLRYCETPAAAADLAVGRALEARHCLHLDGERGKLLAWLTTQKPELASPEAFSALETVAYPATKPIYAQLTNLLGKVFTAQGRSFFYSFADAALADDFTAYLASPARTGQSFYNTFRKTWLRAALVGFQGVYLVDLPATAAADGRPAPFADFIASTNIHDIRLTGNRVEYLVLSQQLADAQTLYFCYDDQQCHRVLHAGGKYAYLPADTTTHGLGYVPACPVTGNAPDPLRPVRRTSPLDASLEVATVYLRDANMHEMMKAFQGYAKPWSYGVDCEHKEVYDSAAGVMSQCSAGYIYAPNGVTCRRCSNCGGRGKVIPVGPDKVYILKPAPAGETSPVNPGPAGYIVPELASAKYIGDEMVKNEAKIEKAVLGKSGLLDQQKQDTLGGKILDWGPAYDRFADLSADGEACYKFVTDTKARLRYGTEALLDSSVSFGRKYLADSLDQMRTKYAEMKKGGVDDGMLYQFLEDMVYAEWANDPMELERNLLKLELTPFPTATVSEAVLDGIGTPDDLLLKRYINNFFDRFERENGSILEFGSLLTHGAKIERIQQAFAGYVAEKRAAMSAPIVPPVLPKPPVTGTIL